MHYMGSKKRFTKRLLDVMEPCREGRPWVEPFVGGANVICMVDGGVRIGNDENKYLIALLMAVRDGWVPPTTVTKEEYECVRLSPNNYHDNVVGFIGFACSFGGKWWGGYAKNQRGDNYARQGSNSLVKQAKRLQGVQFQCGDYRQMIMPPESLVYCDPPYQNTTRYAGKDPFNHDEFWAWCREKSNEGHLVFVSEYQAPPDFRCVLEMDTETLLDRNVTKKKVERLFTYNTET